MVNYKELEDLLDTPTPCEGDLFKCVFYNTCKNKELACRDFNDFVETGRIVNKNRLPRKSMYNLVFQGNDLGDLR